MAGFQAPRDINDALKVGGAWYISFKYGSGERKQGGRYFTDLDEIGLNRLV